MHTNQKTRAPLVEARGTARTKHMERGVAQKVGGRKAVVRRVEAKECSPQARRLEEKAKGKTEGSAERFKASNILW